ncbi:MAG: rhodanese-like domain-containing protein [Puniceicoccaceae bacterium]
MKALLWYGIFPCLLAGASVLWHPSPASWEAPQPAEGELRLQDLEQWPGEVLWVDARNRESYDAEHVPGAVWLSESGFDAELMGLLERWQPGARVVVYCDSEVCDASHAVARRLREEVGLPEVWVLFGGWKAWQRSR